MGVRATGRKLAMQALYQAEVKQCDIQDVIAAFIEGSDYQKETKDWAILLASNAWESREFADKTIKRLSKDWSFDRIMPVDKSILRLALYEMTETDTPHKIVVNEAIEISKRYSTEDSPRFINGILGQCIEPE